MIRPLSIYQAEERSLIARRLIAARYRLKDLIDCMEQDNISTQEKVKQLSEDLSKHQQEWTTSFLRDHGRDSQTSAEGMFGQAHQEGDEYLITT